MITRRISLVAGATAALAIGAGTHAFADAATAQAAPPTIGQLTSDPVGTVTGVVGDPIGTVNGLLGTVAGVDPTGIVGVVLQDVAGGSVSTVTGIVTNPTGAVSSLFGTSTSAVSGVLDTASQADPIGVVGGVVTTVTSTRGTARVNSVVPAPPPVSLPSVRELPAVVDLNGAVGGTVNSVTGTVSGLLGPATSSLPLSLPSISSIDR